MWAQQIVYRVRWLLVSASMSQEEIPFKLLLHCLILLLRLPTYCRISGGISRSLFLILCHQNQPRYCRVTEILLRISVGHILKRRQTSLMKEHLDYLSIDKLFSLSIPPHFPHLYSGQTLSEQLAVRPRRSNSPDEVLPEGPGSQMKLSWSFPGGFRFSTKHRVSLAEHMTKIRNCPSR